MSQGQVVTPYNYSTPTIWGAKGGCFPADTQILTPTDSTSIQDCCVGDKVLCYTPDGKVFARPITETHVHKEKYKLLQFVFDTGKLILTPNHWVLRGEGQYDYASEFEIGDTLVNLEGVKKIILQIDDLPPEIVYNLTVQDHHTFFLCHSNNIPRIMLLLLLHQSIQYLLLKHFRQSMQVSHL